MVEFTMWTEENGFSSGLEEKELVERMDKTGRKNWPNGR